MNWLKRTGKLVAGLLLTCVFFLLLLYRSDIPAEEIAEKYRTPESHFIDVDGIKVHIRIMGEGEPIFLLHGSFSSLHTWDVWQKELSPYFMTISLDFPGHGLTGPDELKRYSVQDYSELVLSLAEKLNLRKYHLTGSSMGGAVALHVASARPDKILTLNLVDTSGAPKIETRSLDGAQNPGRGSGAWIFKLIENPLISKIFLKCTPKFLFAKNMKEVYADASKIQEKDIDRYYELMLREGNRQATLDRISIPRNSKVDFERLTMPTLILWGGQDSWIPINNAYALEKAIPGSYLIVFDQAGHVPMEEIPTESVAEYLSFLGVEVRKNYLEAPKQMVYAD